MSTELTEKGKHAFCEETIRLKESIERDYVALGGRLAKAQEERLWGAGWESWEEYIMEFKFSTGTASKLINIWRLRERFNVPEEKLALAGGWTVVAEYLPLVKDETKRKEVMEWIEDAAKMPRHHIRQTVMEKRKGIPDDHVHDLYTLRCCRTCPYRERVHHGEAE